MVESMLVAKVQNLQPSELGESMWTRRTINEQGESCPMEDLPICLPTLTDLVVLLLMAIIQNKMDDECCTPVAFTALVLNHPIHTNLRDLFEFYVSATLFGLTITNANIWYIEERMERGQSQLRVSPLKESHFNVWEMRWIKWIKEKKMVIEWVWMFMKK